MYIYFSTWNFKSYAVDEPIFLVVENGFEFQSPVRAFWRWTVDGAGQSGTLKLVEGTVDRAEQTSYPDAGSTYGMFYDLYYPLDVVLGPDCETVSVTVYELPKSDSACSVVSTFTMYRVYSCRTESSDYDPTVFLPPVRYYSLGYFNGYLFALIAPDALCHDGTIWVTCEDDDYIYFMPTQMLLDDQDDDTVTAEFDVEAYRFKVQLDKHDDSWTLLSSGSADASSGDESSSSSSSALSSDDSSWWSEHADLPDFKRRGGQRNAYMAKSCRSRANKAQRGVTAQPLSAARSPQPKVGVPKVGVPSQFGHEISVHVVVPRAVSVVVNDTTDQAVYCELAEGTRETKDTVEAIVGLGLAVVGLLPIGSLSTPVGLYSTLLAGIGLYDALNKPREPQKRLLFPGERLERRTSGGTPIGDNNDLTLMLADIKDKSLRYRAGTKKGVGSTTLNVSDLLAETGLLTDVMTIAGSDFDTKKVEACKIIKMVNVIPKYNQGDKLEDLSTASYYDLADGQIIYSDADSSQTLYNLFDGTRSDGTALFDFQYYDKQCSVTLFHAYGATRQTSRKHDIVHLPGSNFKLLKIQQGRIEISNDSLRNSLAANMRDEDDVLDNISKFTSKGYQAWSWSYNSNLFGYRLIDLARHSGSVMSTNSDTDIVYLPVSSWLPWQRIVDK